MVTATETSPTTDAKPRQGGPADLGGSDRLRLFATDVTGSHELEAPGIDRSTPAGAVANAFANRMELPTNVPWGLRNDETAAYLSDDEPIGDQIETGSRVVVTPKSHLG